MLMIDDFVTWNFSSKEKVVHPIHYSKIQNEFIIFFLLDVA